VPPIVRHTFVELVVAFPDASVQLAPAPRFAAAFAQEFLEVYAATNNKFSTLAAKSPPSSTISFPRLRAPRGISLRRLVPAMRARASFPRLRRTGPHP